MRFEGRSQKDVDGKADTWLAANPRLRNVQMRATEAGARRRTPKGAGRWSIVLSFDD